jgi:hypothetical protein
VTQPESHIVQSILEHWGAHPRLRIARINTGKAYPPHSKRLVTFGVPGTADIVGLIAPTGRMLMIECKTATGKQRKAQETMERVVTQFGGIYLLARSLADVDRAMAAWGIYR